MRDVLRLDVAPQEVDRRRVAAVIRVRAGARGRAERVVGRREPEPPQAAVDAAEVEARRTRTTARAARPAARARTPARARAPRFFAHVAAKRNAYVSCAVEDEQRRKNGRRPSHAVNCAVPPRRRRCHEHELTVHASCSAERRRATSARGAPARRRRPRARRPAGRRPAAGRGAGSRTSDHAELAHPLRRRIKRGSCTAARRRGGNADLEVIHAGRRTALSSDSSHVLTRYDPPRIFPRVGSRPDLPVPDEMVKWCAVALPPRPLYCARTTDRSARPPHDGPAGRRGAAQRRVLRHERREEGRPVAGHARLVRRRRVPDRRPQRWRRAAQGRVRGDDGRRGRAAYRLATKRHLVGTRIGSTARWSTTTARSRPSGADARAGDARLSGARGDERGEA